MLQRRMPDSAAARIAMFILAAFIMLPFMPRDRDSSYVYEENRPWAHSLLTAPFDIPVYLDSASARAVHDSIVHTFEPVYSRSAAIEKEMTANFSRRLNSEAGRSLTPAQRNALIEAVKKVYSDGVVTPQTYAEITSGRMPAVRFIHNNVAISMSTASFVSPRVAYARLDSMFRTHSFRLALLQVNPSDMLRPNITVDSVATERLFDDIYRKAMAPVGVIQKGERIIDRGDIVTPSLATVLATYERLSQERTGKSAVSAHHYPVLGYVLYTLLLLGGLYAYLPIFRPRYFHDGKTIAFLLLMLVASFVLAYVMNSAFSLGLYIVPFTIIPIMCVIFLDSRTAMYVHILQILMAAMLAAFPLEFIFVQMIGGMAAIDSIKELSRRSQLIRTAVYVFIFYLLAYTAIEVMLTGSVDKFSGQMAGCLAINAVMVSFAYVLLFIAEKLFGFTSRVTLVELSDINNPLLRKLSEECPGTFQHSMAVSNLASAAASRVDANVQLVRAGALYHDIGKISNPAFFTENQHGINPHDSLDPLQSAAIVISHVTEGLRMADKAKLPPVIRDFISEHHGTGKARYFYNTWCNAHPELEPDPAPFTYPGPNPRTRETSILMMADAVEAASRSLDDHSPEAIEALVNRIIDAQINEGLHNDSQLSFHDVKVIKQVFIQRLATMFHTRISYPENRKEHTAPGAESTAPEATTPEGNKPADSGVKQ